jgi:Tfp pilus assembly protein PilV
MRMLNKSMRLKLILFLCRSRSPVPDSGLSMLEVLVAMMVVFLTFMTSLNGLLYAAMFQVKADRQAKAVYWIQQDVENVKSAAANYTDPSGCSTSTVGTLFNATVPAVSIAAQDLFGKNYTINRVPVPSANILQITYTVRETSDTSKILATLYTEILPAAALGCS